LLLPEKEKKRKVRTLRDREPGNTRGFYFKTTESATEKKPPEKFFR